MDILKSASELKKLIIYTNKLLLSKNKGKLVQKNCIVVKNKNSHAIDSEMSSFTNSFVQQTIEKNSNCEAFVISDIAQMDVKGKKISYFLYKGYHNLIDKGLVCYQLIDENTFEPTGNLQFSNSEENIFFNIKQPKIEESSCNAIETKNHTKEKPEIAFIIGHVNKERLLYDIQRLIIDTANNVSKNQDTYFKFIIQVSLFNSNDTTKLMPEINEIEKQTKKHISPLYTNTSFVFELGED